MHRRSCMPRRTTAACGAPRTAAGTGSRRGLTGRFISDVTVDPVKRHVVWAATSTGLYRSGNDGRTWKRRLKLDRSVSVVAIAPSNRRFVYAGTYDRGSTAHGTAAGRGAGPISDNSTP